MLRTLLFVTGASFITMGCTVETTTEIDADVGSQSDADDPSTDESGSGSEFAVTSENTKVLFVGTKKSGDSKSGGFKTVSGSIGVDGDSITSVNVVIDVESIFSEAEKLTAHLKNEDFFSAKEFPELKFESTKVEGTGEVTVTGNLTMHGQTAEISFPATATVTEGDVKLNGKFKVDRTKFGMNYTGKPDDPINAEVDIEISVGGDA